MDTKISTHKSTFRISFSDTDAAGVAHFSFYFRLMENTEHELYRRLGTTAFTTTGSEQAGLPRVHASCDYHHPLHFEEEVGVELRVGKVGERSIHYDFLFTRKGDSSETLIAEGHMRVVYAARLPENGGFEPRVVPPEIADHLEVWRAPSHT